MPEVKRLSASEEVALDDVLETGHPLVIEGAVEHWPLVAAGQASPNAAAHQLSEMMSGAPVTAFFAEPAAGGRFFYNDDMTGFNFTSRKVPTDVFLSDLMAEVRREDPRAIYAGSTDVPSTFPGFMNHHRIADRFPRLGHDDVFSSLWIGNRTVAATHFDASNNMACCLVGRRRFTLFPPDQISNLYPGPLFPTPAGQVVSMVDLGAPDFDRFPRFEEARRHAVVADLNPGDAVIYPAMWWHQVEALDPFNIMVNYWWNDVPSHVDDPMIALLVGLLSLRSRPAHEREAWRGVLDHFVFGEVAAEHLPEHLGRELRALTPETSRKLRTEALRRINR